MGRNGAQTLHWLDKKLTTESSHMKVFYLLFRIFTDISPYAIWLYLFCNQTVPLTTLFLDKSSIKWISLEPAEAITLSEKVELKKKYSWKDKFQCSRAFMQLLLLTSQSNKGRLEPAAAIPGLLAHPGFCAHGRGKASW